MQLVINHLTRMRGERICVAGVGDEGHVRPITRRDTPLTRDLLKENGGPLAIGALVDVGDARHDPNPPETEDHRVWVDHWRAIDQLGADDYLELVDAHCEETLEAVFGPKLQRHEWTYAVDEGQGTVSLGCLRPRDRPDIEVNQYGSVRLRFKDPSKPAFLPVTDLRLFEPEGAPRGAVVEDVADRMRRGVGVRLMLGLGRAWTKDGDEQPRHWLQVNGLCLEDRPLGDGGEGV